MVQAHIKKEHVDIFFIFGLSACLIVVMSLVSVIDSHKSLIKTISIVKKDTAIDQKEIFDKTAFTNVTIEGKAYIVYDLLDDAVIASKNETLSLPLASITKVMTAVSSTLHKDRKSKITVTDKSIEDGYDLGLKKNQVWSLEELLKYTLVFSSNDGAQVVADSFGAGSIFLSQMNQDAKDYGLTATFTDAAGRDIGDEIGGKGTVLDVAKLFMIARGSIPEILDATTKKRANLTANTGRVTGIPNTNQQIQDMPGAEASKTGFTDMAGGNLGVIVDVTVGHPVVIVVLGSTREGRFKDMEVLYAALRKSIQSKSQDPM